MTGDNTKGVMKTFDIVSAVLLVIGGLNWGLIGFFGFDLVASVFGSMSLFSKILYPVLETQINEYNGNNIEIINDVLMGFKDYSKQF